MRVGIITITIGELVNRFNYGNKLQNYAMYKTLSDLGYKCDSVLYKTETPQYTNRLLNKKKKNTNFYQLVTDCQRIIKRKIYKRKLKELTQKRANSFLEFNNKYLSFTDKVYTDSKSAKELVDNYDFFVIGSDQVWNPYYEGYNNLSYASFSNSNKIITYAPSFGVSEIPDEIKKEIKERIQNIKFLSIREKTGQSIIKKEFNRNAIWVCDPVFLLDSQQWDEIQGDSSVKIEDEYIFVYLLGKKSYKTKKYIKTLSKKLNLKIIDIYSWDNPDSLFGGPIEFLKCIKNCKLVISDSFHATAFSIIYDKPILIVDRNSTEKESSYKMNSRIDDLLDLVKMKGKLSIVDYIHNPEKIWEIKYNKDELNCVIDKSKKYLLTSLEEVSKYE